MLVQVALIWRTKPLAQNNQLFKPMRHPLLTINQQMLLTCQNRLIMKTWTLTQTWVHHLHNHSLCPNIHSSFINSNKLMMCNSLISHLHLMLFQILPCYAAAARVLFLQVATLHIPNQFTPVTLTSPQASATMVQQPPIMLQLIIIMDQTQWHQALCHSIHTRLSTLAYQLSNNLSNLK